MAPLAIPSSGSDDFVDEVAAASAPLWWGIGSTAVIVVFSALGVWYAHVAYRAKKREMAVQAMRELEAAVADATELTDLSTRPSPSASPPPSPPPSPLVLPAAVVALSES